MKNLLESTVSVIMRTAPNLVLLILLTRFYELAEVSDALYAITVCTVIASFVDYGLNDRFNVRCTNVEVNFNSVFYEFAVFRAMNSFLVFMLLLASFPLFSNTDVYKFCIVYFPLSVIFLIQSLIMSVARFKFSFQEERKLQIIHSCINIFFMIFVQSLLSLDIEVFFVTLILLRLGLMFWLLFKVDLLSLSNSFICHVRKQVNGLKENFLWFLSHSLAIIYLNVDIIILATMMNETDFVIYQLIIRLLLTMTFLSLGANPVVVKKLRNIHKYGGVSFAFEILQVLIKTMWVFMLIAFLLPFIIPFIMILVFQLESNVLSLNETILLSAFFYFRVFANIYDVSYAVYDMNVAKTISMVSSIVILAGSLFIFVPTSMFDALIILVLTSVVNLVIKHFLLYCSVLNLGRHNDL